jgi:hypothetical protein
MAQGSCNYDDIPGSSEMRAALCKLRRHLLHSDLAIPRGNLRMAARSWIWPKHVTNALWLNPAQLTRELVSLMGAMTMPDLVRWSRHGHLHRTQSRTHSKRLEA